MLLNTPTEEGNKKFKEVLEKFKGMEKFNISILHGDFYIIIRSLAIFIEDKRTSDSERKHAVDLVDRIEQQIIKKIQLIEKETDNGADN